MGYVSNTKVKGSFKQAIQSIRKLRESHKNVIIKLDNKKMIVTYDKTIPEYPRKTVFLRLIDSCNSKCVICDWWKHQSNSYLPLDMIKKVLFEAFILNFDHIKITGAEPTLHPNFSDVVKLSKFFGFRIELGTNSIINKQILENAAFFDEITFSLHSDKKQIHEKIN